VYVFPPTFERAIPEQLVRAHIALTRNCHVLRAKTPSYCLHNVMGAQMRA